MRLIPLGALTLFSAIAVGQASTYQDLHDFGGTTTLSNGTSGTDGIGATTLIIDKLGDKFMTTNSGGLYNQGGIFELTAQGQYVDLHDFQADSMGTSIGIDASGNLIGTCGSGGTYNAGTLWRLTPTGVYTILHNFGGPAYTSNGTKGQDGLYAVSSAIDGRGNIFGVCVEGGLYYNSKQPGGMVFEYTAAGAYKDLHDFGATIVRADGETGQDGIVPENCVLDSSGNLFGETSEFADLSSGGNFWEISAAGTFIDLHDFGGTYHDSSGNSKPDGAYPRRVILDGSGNVYGVTIGYSSESGGGSIAWEFTTGHDYKVLYDFGSSGTGYAEIALDKTGDLFGATAFSVWEISSAGAFYDLSDWSTFHVPGQVAFDSSGILFGDTQDGGQYGQDGSGVLYSLKIGSYLKAVSASPTSVTSGLSATGTVTFELPTPNAVVVSLSSSDTYVTVPATVTVPAGSLTATFPITTTEAATDQTATLTASYAGYQVTTTFTAGRIAVSGITLPTYVTAGTTVTGTVTLNGKALSGGLTVNLSTNQSNVTVTPSVTVPQGQSSTQFTLVADPSSANSVPTIFATDDNASYIRGSTDIVFQSITNLTISPTEAAGTIVFTATATINGIAPSAGIPLTITSSSSLATPPSTVTVPSGQTSVSFQIPTSAVTAKTAVTVTGTSNPSAYSPPTSSATITLDPPPTISKLTVSPGEGPSGSTFTATATINEIAPPGGTTITLASNSSYVSPPATVTVPAGSTTVSFPVATSGVPNTINVLLRGTTGSTAQAVYFTIDAVPAPPLTNLTVSPGEALGGTTFTGTITLASPAPYPISVSTATNSSFVSIPAIVVVPTGSTTATYSIKTKVVYNTIPVLLKATLGSTTKTVYVTLDATPIPVALSSITVSPGEGTGGSTFTATVTLNGPAPTGGYVVALATNSSYLSPPASVTVPAGSTSVSFSVPSSVVSKSVSALLKASDSSTTKTVYVTLDP